jgi:hypothetical protein
MDINFSPRTGTPTLPQVQVSLQTPSSKLLHANTSYYPNYYNSNNNNENNARIAFRPDRSNDIDTSSETSDSDEENQPVLADPNARKCVITNLKEINKRYDKYRVNLERTARQKKAAQKLARKAKAQQQRKSGGVKK